MREEPAGESFPKRGVVHRQCADIDHKRRGSDMEAVELGLDERIPEVFVLGGKRGEAGEGFFGGWVAGLGQRGEDLMADAVAGQAQVRIGGILTPGDAARGQPGPDFIAPDLNQRTDNALGGDGPDCRESCGRSAAEHAKEHGLGLIGEGMAGGDALQVMVLHGLKEEGPAGVAGCLLDVPGRVLETPAG